MNQRTTYWIQAAVWLICVYGSIPIVRPICEALRRATPLNLLVNILVVGILVFILIYNARKTQLSMVQYALIVFVLVLYGVGFYLIKIPEERIHFLQYGLLAFLIHRAIRLDYRDYRAYIFAFFLTCALGWLDEGIQYITPQRYYDTKDVILNCVSGGLGLLMDFAYRRSN